MHKLFSFLEVGREIVTPVLVINAYIFDCNLGDDRLKKTFYAGGNSKSICFIPNLDVMVNSSCRYSKNLLVLILFCDFNYSKGMKLKL